MKKFLCIVCSLLFLCFCPIRALPVDAARAVYAPTDLKIDQTTSGGTLTVTGSCTARPGFTAELTLTLQVYREEHGWHNVHTRAQWELHDGRHTATIRSLYPHRQPDVPHHADGDDHRRSAPRIRRKNRVCGGKLNKPPVPELQEPGVSL